ncbi:IclR family transcriptional regulator [Leifsonia sp. H3M29-4]|uniref:IclR family transcriptional regulator n=1 Tax=Salinibacterium metalliresistens TaxID=3031321 RepID=UPI0023DB032E|nr:IclR family transcriptional regulator [Salinibacterium metalliresistens]MDF1478154.1 IclR family transcriptional regulator [Salinibacterium metalliresistens]
MAAGAATKENATGTQSVERALSVLSCFTQERPQLRISELVELTGLGQSTVSRLVGAMLGLGFLSLDERSGLYTAGPQVVTLAAVALNQSPVHQAGRQLAQSLAAELGLGVNLAERRGTNLFYLAHFEGADAPRSATMIGRGGPLHATGLGKALLSDLSREEVAEQLGPGPFPQYTGNTLTTLDELVADLDSVRSRGYAVELEELALRRACVAAPIRDRSGAIVAALSISGPMSAIRLPERTEALAVRAIERADQISSDLGFHASRR